LELKFPEKNLKDFCHCLKSNSSLVNLNLSKEFRLDGEPKELKRLVDVLSSHQTIEFLSMKVFNEIKEFKGFHKLLTNSKLKELRLNGCIQSAEDCNLLFFHLNKNENLNLLDISGQCLDFILNWNKIKITNKTIQKINMAGLI
jgi:hypothetical protein